MQAFLCKCQIKHAFFRHFIFTFFHDNENNEKVLNDLVYTVEAKSSTSTGQAKKESAHSVITSIISEKLYSTPGTVYNNSLLYIMPNTCLYTLTCT